MRGYRLAAVAITILLLAIGFVVSTWAYFLNRDGLVGASGIALLALGYIPVAILGFQQRHPLLRIVAVPAGVGVGLLSLGFVGAFACWAAAGATWALGISIELRTIGLAVSAVGFVAAIYGLINAATIQITPYTVALPNLPPQWVRRTGVLVSDVHLGNIRSEAFARRVVARVNALGPDIVFISGDLFDGALVDLAACAAPWGALHAPMGTYFVTGNHDEFSDSAEIMAALRKVGVRVLDNEKVTVDGLQIVGVHDGVARDERGFAAILARAQIDRDDASILLNHQPSHLRVPQEAGMSLQLSGHTHRGQMWPWRLIVERIFGPFAYGLNRSGTLQVITSSGVGTWGPPMRVGSRSEIVRIEFAGANR